MLDNSKVDFYDIIGIHIQTLVAIAKNQKLFIPSWKNIVIPEHNNLSEVAKKINEEEIEKAWKMLPHYKRAYTILDIVIQRNMIALKHEKGVVKIITRKRRETKMVLNALKHIPLDVFF